MGMLSSCDSYRQKAAEMIRLADKTVDVELRQNLLSMALRWDHLAREVEDGFGSLDARGIVAAKPPH